MGRRESVGDDGSYWLCCARHSISLSNPGNVIPSGCRPSGIASTTSGASQQHVPLSPDV